MLGISNLEPLFRAVLSLGLVKQVFHSVIIRDDGTGQKKPSAPVGNRFQYVGIDDSRGFICYCRAVGPLEITRREKVGGCGKQLLTARTPHRMVFYNAEAKGNADSIAGLFVNAFLGKPGIEFNRLLTNAEDFIRQEQPTGGFTLKPRDLYFAIEFTLIQTLVDSSECQPAEIACGHLNPYCL